MKNIVITGSSRGIGKCLVENLAKDGHNVILNYNKSEKQAKQIKASLEEHGIKIEIFKADISKREEVKKLIKFAIRKMKTLMSIRNYVIKSVSTPKTAFLLMTAILIWNLLKKSV